jgi:UDP-N-acetyl-D-glucosamine dehydrogenase
VLELLSRRGAQVSYPDPYVPPLRHAGHTLESVPFDTAVRNGLDCAVIAADHSCFDCAKVAAMPLVVDTRNSLRAFLAVYKL